MLLAIKKFKGICLLALGLLTLISLSVHAESANPLFHEANDPVAGNPQGKVTIVEFFDYQCSHCIDAASTVSDIIKTNPTVKVVFKELPIRGPMSEFAARAALAANIQGKYVDFHHALFSASQPLTEEEVLKIAKKEGLNTAKLILDMNGETVKKQLQNNLALAEKMKIPGTPAFFIGKTNTKLGENILYIKGSMDQGQMQSVINGIDKLDTLNSPGYIDVIKLT